MRGARRRESARARRAVGVCAARLVVVDLLELFLVDELLDVHEARAGGAGRGRVGRRARAAGRVGRVYAAEVEVLVVTARADDPTAEHLAAQAGDAARGRGRVVVLEEDVPAARLGEHGHDLGARAIARARAREM